MIERNAPEEEVMRLERLIARGAGREEIMAAWRRAGSPDMRPDRNPVREPVVGDVVDVRYLDWSVDLPSGEKGNVSRRYQIASIERGMLRRRLIGIVFGDVEPPTPPGHRLRIPASFGPRCPPSAPWPSGSTLVDFRCPACGATLFGTEGPEAIVRRAPRKKGPCQECGTTVCLVVSPEGVLSAWSSDHAYVRYELADWSQEIQVATWRAMKNDSGTKIIVRHRMPSPPFA